MKPVGNLVTDAIRAVTGGRGDMAGFTSNFHIEDLDTEKLEESNFLFYVDIFATFTCTEGGGSV